MDCGGTTPPSSGETRLPVPKPPRQPILYVFIRRESCPSTLKPACHTPHVTCHTFPLSVLKRPKPPNPAGRRWLPRILSGPRRSLGFHSIFYPLPSILARSFPARHKKANEGGQRRTDARFGVGSATVPVAVFGVPPNTPISFSPTSAFPCLPKKANEGGRRRPDALFWRLVLGAFKTGRSLVLLC